MDGDALGGKFSLVIGHNTAGPIGVKIVGNFGQGKARFWELRQREIK